MRSAVVRGPRTRFHQIRGLIRKRKPFAATISSFKAGGRRVRRPMQRRSAMAAAPASVVVELDGLSPARYRNHPVAPAWRDAVGMLNRIVFTSNPNNLPPNAAADSGSLRCGNLAYAGPLHQSERRERSL